MQWSHHQTAVRKNVMLSGLIGVVASISTEEFLEQQQKDFMVYRKREEEELFLLCGPLSLVRNSCTPNVDIIKSGNVLSCQPTRHISAGEEISSGFDVFHSKEYSFSGKENLDTVSLLSQQTLMGSPVPVKRPYFLSSNPLHRVRDPLHRFSNNVSRVEEQTPEDDTDEEELLNYDDVFGDYGNRSDERLISIEDSNSIAQNNSETQDDTAENQPDNFILEEDIRSKFIYFAIAFLTTRLSEYYCLIFKLPGNYMYSELKKTSISK